jgi:farnesyl diphosphate synthase
MAVELTHTASLLLDDLPCMDDSDERRGQPSTHTVVGSAGAILLAVGMLARSAELLGNQPHCGGDLARDWGRSFGLAGMAGGQAVDVAASGQLRGAKRRLHRAKSTLLPALALGAGARIARASEPVRLGLEGYGRAVGWAYQLLDDIEDAQEDEALGRASSASPCPARHSERIMRWSTRRLRAMDGLEPDARELLIALTQRVIPVMPSAASTSGPQTSSWQGRC